MPTIDEALSIAVAQQQAGRMNEAAEIYRQILAVEPNHPAAWHLLGVLHSQTGRFEAAVQHIGRALELAPGYAEAHANLGNAYYVQGKWDEAATCYLRALELKPGLDDARINLAKAWHAQGKFAEAVGGYGQAIERRPNDAELHFNLGAALKDMGQPGEAAAAYRRALTLKPEYVKAHNNLGTVLRELGDFDAAIACYRRALALQPDLVEAHNNLGNAFRELGDAEAAAASSRRAVELRPDNAEAHNSLGRALHGLGDFDGAAACYHRALELKPDFPFARFNRSLLSLLTGNFERAWPEFEWRWQTDEFPRRVFQQPRWAGEPIAGRTILLFAEQGLGDTIQFVRYAALVKKLGAKTIVECQRPLRKLLAACPGIDELVGTGDELPTFDVQAPLLSLPGIFKTLLATIPANGPYLFADGGLVAEWRERLPGREAFRIGIQWQGGKKRGGFGHRDIPLDCFAPLAAIPGVRLISLQQGEPRKELAKRAKELLIDDLGEAIDTVHGPFMDTAAIAMNLDLVITCDTSLPHLAGALGVPVWVALPFVPDWRWLLGRSDSPWYPTMRLFRQPSAGDWTSVFQEIRAALEAAVKPSP